MRLRLWAEAIPVNMITARTTPRSVPIRLGAMYFIIFKDVPVAVAKDKWPGLVFFL